MSKLETPLIANRDRRILSALGYKQMNRIIDKAAQINGTHRYSKDFNQMKDQVTYLVKALVFDYNITKEQLSAFQRIIKVKSNTKSVTEAIALINKH